MSTEIVPATSTVVDHYQSPAAPVIADRELRYLQAQAKQLAGTNLVPPALRGKPDDVLLVCLWGHSIGLPPVPATQNIHIIEGRPFPGAAAVQAAAQARGHRVQCVKATATECTVRALRRGDDPSWAIEVTWTMADAQRAGLTKKDNWTKYPGQMLFARAVREAVKRACPEVLMGMQDAGWATDEEPPPPTYTVTAQVDQPAAIEAAVAPAWADLWRSACKEARCPVDVSKALIHNATQGLTVLSADVPEGMRGDCELLLNKWITDQPADVAAWLDEPEAE